MLGVLEGGLEGRQTARMEASELSVMQRDTHAMTP